MCTDPDTPDSPAEFTPERCERLKTRAEEYLITKTTASYLRLQVLHGEDQGIRVHVPVYHETYTEELETELAEMTSGSVIRAVLISDSVDDPTWHINELLERER